MTVPIACFVGSWMQWCGLC